MKEYKLINAVNKAYVGVKPCAEVLPKYEFTVNHEEAKRLMKPTSIRLQPSLKLKIEALAEKEGRSFNNMMTRILEAAVA